MNFRLFYGRNVSLPKYNSIFSFSRSSSYLAGLVKDQTLVFRLPYLDPTRNPVTHFNESRFQRFISGEKWRDENKYRRYPVKDSIINGISSLCEFVRIDIYSKHFGDLTHVGIYSDIKKIYLLLAIYALKGRVENA